MEAVIDRPGVVATSSRIQAFVATTKTLSHYMWHLDLYLSYYIWHPGHDVDVKKAILGRGITINNSFWMFKIIIINKGSSFDSLPHLNLNNNNARSNLSYGVSTIRKLFGNNYHCDLNQHVSLLEWASTIMITCSRGYRQVAGQNRENMAINGAEPLDGDGNAGSQLVEIQQANLLGFHTNVLDLCMEDVCKNDPTLGYAQGNGCIIVSCGNVLKSFKDSLRGSPFANVDSFSREDRIAERGNVVRRRR
ncbi:hypothetical protein HPP92_015963 [Vanilla planifolia]|uniref:Uncharacterized protein n=1 Tax=Vanilla planifolia TaxID=51239 RepID=A0A835QNA1_VANPL|nr:hypothetical protein HPP92_015963 [Vanilla planifolia]